jgi:hypothetical protein
MVLWFVLALMTLAAILAVVWPLARANRRAGPRADRPTTTAPRHRAAQDWAEIAEPGQIPFYEAAFEAAAPWTDRIPPVAAGLPSA